MKKIITSISVIMTATLVVSGLFIFNTVLADTHTTSVTVSPEYVAGGTSDTYTFVVTNNGADSIYKIVINAPSGFTIDSDPTCPTNWESSHTSGGAQCLTDAFGGDVLNSGDNVQLSFSATVPTPGNDTSYDWTVLTKDSNAGYEFTNTEAKITVDVTAPITIDNAPPEGWQTTKPVTVTLECEDGAGSGCVETKYTTDGSDPKTNGIPGDTIEVADEGTTTIKYYSIDNVGNEEGVKQTQVQIDTIASETTDDATDSWVSTDVLVTLEATDDSSGVAAIYYTIDGMTPTTESTLYEEPFILSDEGIYPLIYFSVDNAGNAEEIKTGTLVKIDKTAPVTSYAIDPIDPNGDGEWYTMAPTITLTCTDQEELSGCENIYYRWGEGEDSLYSDSIQAPEGNNTFYYYSEDSAGNIETTQSIEIKVDTTPPTITDDSPEDWQTHDVSFNLNPQDNGNGSGIKEVKLNEGVLDDPYTITYDTEGIFTGSYQAWDNAGNASDIGSYTVSIDKTSPMAGVSEAPADWTKETQTATVTCSDTGGSDCDIESFKYKVDSSNPGSCSTNVGEYTLGTSANITEHSWVCSYVKDNAGNEDFSDLPIEFKVDQIPPTGQLTNVPETWQNTDTTIGLDYSDTGGSGIANAFLDIVAYGTVCEVVTLYGEPQIVSQHSTVCWKVTDIAGNERTGSEEIKVDKTIPIVDAGIDAITNAEVTQDATANDADSGVSSYLWEKVSGIGVVTFGTPNTEDTTISVDADGIYEIKLTATDNAGNSANDTMQLTWDTVSPTVAITSPIDTVYKVEGLGSIDLIFTASDPEPGTAVQHTYKVDNEEYIAPVVYTEPTTVSINDLSDGRHTLQLKIIDAADNFIESSILTFVIDNNNALTVDDTPENNPDFTTIQAAIDAASVNDTIAVNAGIYTEDLNISTEGINLAGADKTTTIIKGVLNVAMEDWPLAVPNIDVRADGVAIHGFTIEGPDYEVGKYSSGIVIEGANVEIYGNDFKIAAGANTDEISQTIQTYHKDAVSGVDVSGLNIHDNTFTSLVTGDGGYEGIYINLDDGTGSITIQNNQFSGDLVRAITTERSNVQITNNIVITDLAPGLPGGYLGIYIGSAGGTQTAITVMGNTVKGSASGKGFLQGIRIGSSSQIDLSSISVANNTVEGNDNGIYVKNNADGVVVNSNTIINNTVGVQNDDAGNILNATENYWGTAVLATIQGMISGDITFEPYYVDSEMETLNTGSVNEVSIDATYIDGDAGEYIFGYDAFDNIQEGINAVAENGTINVADGTYDELLTINVNGLTLLGAQANVDPRPMNGGRSGAESIIQKTYTIDTLDFNPIKIEADNVIINGFTISPHYEDGVGILVNNDLVRQDPNSWEGTTIKYNILTATGYNIVDNCDELIQLKGVTNAVIEYNYGYHAEESESGGNAFNIAAGSTDSIIRYNEAHNCGDYQYNKWGGAIYTYTSSNIDVIGNKIVDGGGITFGASKDTPDANWPPMRNTGGTIQDNIIEDSGFGLEIFADSVTVSGNNITGCNEYALNIIGQNVIVQGNNLYNSAIGILVEDKATVSSTEVSINTNKIYSNTFGLENLAVAEVDATKNWWGFESGPTHSSNTGGTGDEISDNVSFRPWYTNVGLTDLDTTGPTVTISSSEISPTKTSPVPIIITFSENVTDLTADEIIVTNGVKGDLTGSGANYGINVTPEADGAITVNITDNVAWDLAGNYSTAASQFSITFDSAVPTLDPVSIVSNNANTSLAKVGDVVTVSFTSNEDIDTPSVTIAGKTAAVSGGPTDWTATYEMADGDTEGTVVFAINFTDLAGNPGVEVTSGTGSVTFDKIAPVVGIVTPSENTKVNGTAVISFTTDESLPQCSVDNTTWTSCVTGTTILSDIAEFTGLAQGAFTLYLKDTDTAGNVGTDSISLIKDTVAPTVVSHIPGINALNVESSVVTITFSENMIIDTGDITFSPTATFIISGSGADVVTLTPVSTLQSNTVYTITVTTNTTDEADNGLVEAYFWQFTTATLYDVALNANNGGWNLISLPVVPNDTTIDIVLGDASTSIDVVWMYDPLHPNAINGWLVYVPGNSPETNNISNMTAGYGYWISVKNNTNISGSGGLLSAGPTTPPSRNLTTGWNLVGYYQIPGEDSSTPETAFASLGGTAGLSALWGFNNSTGGFISVTTILPGDAFWISLPSAKVYTPSNL